MIKKLILALFILLNGMAWKYSKAQQVIATAGDVHAKAIGSISYTIGEPVIKTLASVNSVLTQGFQQPHDLHLLHLTTFLQGYYLGGGIMQDVLYNQGVFSNPTVFTDSITIELHHNVFPFPVAFSKKQLINQNGTTTVRGLGDVGQSYYLVVKHRNSLETWSANPITISSNTIYDFTTNANQAFGANQTEVESGVWALYSGDINQDQTVDAFDYILQDPDVINGAFGYLATDLNGDGTVDSFDYILLDANIVNGVGAITP
jgi:hypothetical protein